MKITVAGRTAYQRPEFTTEFLTDDGVCMIKVNDANNLEFWLELRFSYAELVARMPLSENPYREIAVSVEDVMVSVAGEPPMRMTKEAYDQYVARYEKAVANTTRRSASIIIEEGRLPDETDEDFKARVMKAHRQARSDLVPGKGGYINQFGTRVPNPCGEIDSKGRNLDKVFRWLKPTDKMTDEVIDAILTIDEADPEVIIEVQERQREKFLNTFKGTQLGEVVPLGQSKTISDDSTI